MKRGIYMIMALVILAVPLVGYGFAGAPGTSTGKVISVEPTPALEEVDETAFMVSAGLDSAEFDYVGREKTVTFELDGDTWTIVSRVCKDAEEAYSLVPDDFEWTKGETVIDLPDVDLKASYTPVTLSNQRSYLKNGVMVASTYEEVEVWYYTTNQVHLYSRRIDSAHSFGYGLSHVNYGNIVNTDGSISYTSGDSFTVQSLTYQQLYFLNFYVTHLGYLFY